MRNIFDYCNDDRRRSNRASADAPLHSEVMARSGARGALAAQLAANRSLVANFPRVG